MNGIRLCRMSTRLSVLGVLGVTVVFAGCGQPPQVATEQQAAADDLGVAVEITNSIGMKLKLIPAGEFVMGSPESDDTASFGVIRITSV